MTGAHKTRLAVVGCGAAAFGLHLPLLVGHDMFEVVGVADRDPNRARVAAGHFAVPYRPADGQGLLKGADMLVVLTGVHDKLIADALATGVHVFTEKPVSLDLDRTRELRRQANEAGLVLEVGAMRAHDPALRTLLNVVPKACGGWLVKTDGVDAAARRSLLPAEFAPYTFDQDPPQATPADLAEQHLRALQILLWQGYHLLTALVMTIDQPQPITCVLDRTGQSLQATLTGADGQLFALMIGQAPDGVFCEQIHLIGQERAATLDFAQPYGQANRTRLTTRSTTINTSQADGFRDPFACMWAAIGQRLSGQADNAALDSAALAEQVEDLAARLARLAQTVTLIP